MWFLIKGVKTEVAENLVLSEAEFDEFRQYCHEKGFDLSYFGPEILGSKEEIGHYQFSRPQVIKLRKRADFGEIGHRSRSKTAAFSEQIGHPLMAWGWWSSAESKLV